MRFDVHTHTFHPKVADRILAQLVGHYGIAPVGSGIVDDLLARLKTAGLDRAVVHTAATTPAQVIPTNNWAIELMNAHPEIIAFGSIHPDFENAEPELERLEQAGIKGLKFHPDFQGFALNDPSFFRLLEMIGDRFVLMIHVGGNCEAEQCLSSPLKLAEARANFPTPRIIAAHMGGWKHWDLALSTLAGTDIWFDTSSTLPFVDPSTLKLLINAHPSDRILFGSDYPLFDPGEEISRLERTLNLTEPRLEKFLTAASKLFD